MPHAELKYSDDLAIDAAAILAEVEQVILRHDPESGACKGRAFPASSYHHSHLLLAVSMLTKPHRDAVFTQKLMTELERAVKAAIPTPCFFSFSLDYSTGYYVTNEHAGAI